MNDIIRCKFKCNGVTKREGWNGHAFVYDAEFHAVQHGGSDENKAFFAATPSGLLKVVAINADRFEVGREYYIDIVAASVPTTT